MKSSAQVFAALVSALAIFSQPAIATYVHADRQFNVNNDAINVGTKNRTNLLGCSESKPCINDRIVVDSYKEIFSESGKLKEAKIVLYNTSFAPASIEVLSSDGKLKSVEFVDGAKAGFKDLGDFLKTASAGLIGPFQCTTNLFECLSDARYGIEKNERTIKLQSGDFIRISRGSDAAFAYTLASSSLDQVELLASIPGINISKVKNLSLLRNYSPELKRKIIEGFIKEKMRDKYTWGMLIKEFSSETFKKSASNPQDLFNTALEITQNIPQDFWKKMTDGTVASTAAGDGLDTLIQAVSAEGSVFLGSSLLVSQSVNIRARYTASEAAHKQPYVIFIAGLKNSPSSSNQPIATKPSTKISTVPAIANPISHKIGFVKISKSELSQTGICGYSLVGSKTKSDVIFVTGVTERPLMNIDGKNITLESVSKKEIRRNNQILGSTNKYESNIFKITTDFRNVTTSQDRKGFTARERGSIVIVSNDGWRKKVEVECAYDTGG
jgi:hypothetical protein